MNLRGYSYRLVKANKAADSKHIGVKLGRYCIAADIPVAQIAEKFGVSRMTVYNWFMGVVNPHKTTATEIEKLLAKQFTPGAASLTERKGGCRPPCCPSFLRILR